MYIYIYVYLSIRTPHHQPGSQPHIIYIYMYICIYTYTIIYVYTHICISEYTHFSPQTREPTPSESFPLPLETLSATMEDFPPSRLHLQSRVCAEMNFSKVSSPINLLYKMFPKLTSQNVYRSRERAENCWRCQFCRYCPPLPPGPPLPARISHKVSSLLNRLCRNPSSSDFEEMFTCSALRCLAFICDSLVLPSRIRARTCSKERDASADTTAIVKSHSRVFHESEASLAAVLMGLPKRHQNERSDPTILPTIGPRSIPMATVSGRPLLSRKVLAISFRRTASASMAVCSSARPLWAVCQSAALGDATM